MCTAEAVAAFAVGSYFGLVPCEDQSGSATPKQIYPEATAVDPNRST
jgi:hypothetical protein